jgi:DNA-binding NarL/FixJ family response regulator
MAAMIRVLVVDDHPVLRAGLEAVLRAEPGFACVGVAADGRELRDALRRTDPDVVVLDRHLGDEDGLELCAGLRAGPGAPEVVIYTADADARLDEQSTAAGACAVIVKSADVGQLFDALRLAVRPRRPAVA